MLNAASFASAPLRPTLLGRTHPATRLAGLGLGLVSAMLAGPSVLAGWLPLLALGLAWTGLGWRQQVAALRPWLAVAVLVLVVHTFTTVAAAPLGRPSWAGLAAGGLALARVAVSIGLLGLYLRVSTLDELIGGTCWWLAPLARLGLPVADLGLALAVALGTAPAVLGEGRRIDMVVRLRRADHRRATDRRFRLRRAAGRLVDRLVDLAHLVVPLMEGLGRRAEALSLSLRRRRPGPDRSPRKLPPGEVLGLLVWTGLLIWRPW